MYLCYLIRLSSWIRGDIWVDPPTHRELFKKEDWPIAESNILFFTPSIPLF